MFKIIEVNANRTSRLKCLFRPEKQVPACHPKARGCLLREGERGAAPLADWRKFLGNH